MQFSELLIQILDTNNKVFIPTIGELEYDKSKIILNPHATNTGYELVISVAKKLNLPVDEAEKYINQEVENFRRQLNENGEVSFGPKGRLKLRNGEYSFEEKGKQLFPSDFFGGQTTLIDVTPKKEVIIEQPTPVEETKEEVIEEIVVEEPISLVSPEEEKLIAELPIEEQESVREVVEQVNAGVPVDEIFDDVLEETTLPPVDEVQPIIQEPIVEEIVQTAPVEDDVQELINDITVDSDFQAEQNKLTENPNVHVHTIITEEVVQETEPVDEGEDFIHTIEHVTDYQAETNSEFSLLDNASNFSNQDDLVLDESDLDAYDRGHYEYLLNKNTSVKNNWNKIGAAILLFFGVAFMLPWIWASFQGTKFLGMDPLWNSNSKKTAKTDIVSPPVVKADSTQLDSSAMNANSVKADSSALAAANKPQPTTPATQPVATAVPPTKPVATNSTPATTKPAANNTPSKATPTTSKPKTLSQTSSSSNPSRVINVNKSKSTSDTSSQSAPKSSEKPRKSTGKVQGAPYATANYVKGNHYVSFGGFSVPKNAVRLKSDLNSLGVTTDIILVDGMYRVVIPYTSKKHATIALKEYPNTVIID